jgi:radical SAM superfamily enzyme with C-terminal helix-hairpin-helix motif
MLERVFPVGAVVRRAAVERTGTLSLARPLGSYPILLGLPLPLVAGSLLDAVVVDHGQRSVTALPCPVPVNTLPLAALRWIPGVGRKRAAAVASKRPFRSVEDWRRAAGPTPIDHLLSFD